MSAVANIKDGQIVNNVPERDTKKSGGALDKDAFMQLLVAQMKYQDPLQPTSNTEYISQLANFSSLEEMQNLNSGMQLQRASSLVGQYVFMKVTDGSGNVTYPEGQVDYVVYEGNKAYLSINETLYSIDDLDTVADSGYLVATRLAESFKNAMDKLPRVDQVSQSDLEDVEKMIAVYENMTEYQRGFLSKDVKDLYQAYANKYQEIGIKPVKEFMDAMDKLPKAEEITEEHLEDVKKILDTYEGLSDFQKSILPKDNFKIYEALEKKYKELTASEE